MRGGWRPMPEQKDLRPRVVPVLLGILARAGRSGKRQCVPEVGEVLGPVSQPRSETLDRRLVGTRGVRAGRDVPIGSSATGPTERGTYLPNPTTRTILPALPRRG